MGQTQVISPAGQTGRVMLNSYLKNNLDFVAHLDLRGLTPYFVLRIAYFRRLRNTQYAILSLYPTNSKRADFVNNV